MGPRIQFLTVLHWWLSGAAGLVRGIRGLAWRLVSPAGVSRHSGTFGGSKDRRGFYLGPSLSFSAVAANRAQGLLRERCLKSDASRLSGRGKGPSESSDDDVLFWLNGWGFGPIRTWSVQKPGGVVFARPFRETGSKVEVENTV